MVKETKKRGRGASGCRWSVVGGLNSQTYIPGLQHGMFTTEKVPRLPNTSQKLQVNTHSEVSQFASFRVNARVY